MKIVHCEGVGFQVDLGRVEETKDVVVEGVCAGSVVRADDSTAGGTLRVGG